jgi:hypothetical protein
VFRPALECQILSSVGILLLVHPPRLARPLRWCIPPIRLLCSMGCSPRAHQLKSPKHSIVECFGDSSHTMVQLLANVRTDGFLASRCDVFSAVSFENFLRAIHPLVTDAVDGDKNASILHTPFVALRLVFGDAHPD